MPLTAAAVLSTVEAAVSDDAARVTAGTPRTEAVLALPNWLVIPLRTVVKPP